MYYVTEPQRHLAVSAHLQKFQASWNSNQLWGLTSRHGVYCVTEWEDSVNLGRTAIDAATVLTAIAGK